MVKRLAIKPEVGRYDVDRSTKPMEVVQEKVKGSIKSEKQPIDKQLSTIAKVLNVPTG